MGWKNGRKAAPKGFFYHFFKINFIILQVFESVRIEEGGRIDMSGRGYRGGKVVSFEDITKKEGFSIFLSCCFTHKKKEKETTPESHRRFRTATMLPSKMSTPERPVMVKQRSSSIAEESEELPRSLPTNLVGILSKSSSNEKLNAAAETTSTIIHFVIFINFLKALVHLVGRVSLLHGLDRLANRTTTVEEVEEVDMNHGEHQYLKKTQEIS